ncbi:MAG: hypothetical protein AAF556_08575 [Pseudomonadota bacterium]
MLRNILIPGALARLHALLLILAVLAVVGCEELRRTETGIEPSARVQIDQCLASCERDHNICLESTAPDTSQSSSFAAAQQCDRGLSACFDRCRNIGEQPATF